MRGRCARRRNDLLLIGGVLAAAMIGIVLFLVLRTPGGTAVVLINGRETARYPLDTPTQVVLHGGNGGENRLVIRDGKAMIADADCPDRVCVDHGAVSYVGQTIVCLPHELVIRIEGDASDAPDIVI